MYYRPATININQKCTVILTKKGVDTINKHYEDLGMRPPKEFTKGDYYTAELWEIMNIFGDYCVTGLKPPFETEIKVHALS